MSTAQLFAKAFASGVKNSHHVVLQVPDVIILLRSVLYEPDRVAEVIVKEIQLRAARYLRKHRAATQKIFRGYPIHRFLCADAVRMA